MSLDFSTVGLKLQEISNPVLSKIREELEKSDFDKLLFLKLIYHL